MNTKTPESRHVIRFNDCDPLGHLNNARYIDYFLNAREDHEIQFYDFNAHEYTKATEKCWIVSQNQIFYLHPAVLMESVFIQSTILEWNDFDTLIEMRMWDEEKKRLKSLLWTKFIHFDLKRLRPIKHGDDLNKIFKEAENALENKLTFDERIAFAKRKSYADF
ncbi:MAG: acyl-CoA thioesterase [Leptospiraceae bacterium]|nr:acyl-CoA thioesterase [Leptospiraceae bacterium]